MWRHGLQRIADAVTTTEANIASVVHYESSAGTQKPFPVPSRELREKGRTDDGFLVGELDIDYSERPYSVNCAGCARVVLLRA